MSSHTVGLGAFARSLMLAVLAGSALLAGCAADPGTAPGSGSSARTPTTAAHLSLVAIGDSIPNGSPSDCPGCTGFVARYAKAVQDATGKVVDVHNLSQHNGLDLPGLLAELDGFKQQLTHADVIIVGIAHNSNELASDTPCGGTRDNKELPDWSKMTRACSAASVVKYRPLYGQLFTTIAGWRHSKPTILRTINRYNDVLGAPTLDLSPGQNAVVKKFLDDWNPMLCSAAAKAGFGCADLYRAFNGPSGQRPSGDLLGADYTHPSDKGNALIGQVLTTQGFTPLA